MTNEKGGDDVSKRNFYIYLSFIILGGISFLLLIIAFSLFLRKRLLLRARRRSRRENERRGERRRRREGCFSTITRSARKSGCMK